MVNIGSQQVTKLKQDLQVLLCCCGRHTLQQFDKEGRYKETRYFLYVFLVSSLPLAGKKSDKWLKPGKSSSRLLATFLQLSAGFWAGKERALELPFMPPFLTSLPLQLCWVAEQVAFLSELSSETFLLLWYIWILEAVKISAFCLLPPLSVLSLMLILSRPMGSPGKRSLRGFCSASSIKTEQHLLCNLCHTVA